MKTIELLLDEYDQVMATYKPLINELKMFNLSEQQISNVLLLVYNYRFQNAIDNISKLQLLDINLDERLDD